MKFNKTKRLFLVLSLLFFLFASCSNKSREQVFAEKLSYIDSYILEGNRSKALRKLNSLVKKAQTSTNYLSIVKRQLRLDDVPAAIITLQKAVKEMPANPELSAVLISVLVEADRAAEAIPYCANVEYSVFAGLGAEASILTDIESGTFNSNFSFLKSAYDITKDQIFLKNAALSLAKDGKITEAAMLRNTIGEDTAPEEPFFWSCLSYDIGRFDPVFSDLYFSLVYADQAGGEGKFADAARRHLLLAADASFGQGNPDRSRAFWQGTADRSPDVSPVVFYNLAITAPDEKERVDLLLECIERYPAYYPVIARYVRDYLVLRESASQDEIAAYLAERGFYSLQMEKIYFTSPKMTFLPEDLLAKAMQQENFDPRFILEDFRYKQFQDGNRDRGKAEMWKILEKYSEYPEIREYAKWYFSAFRDFDSCFGIGELNDKTKNAFYNALSFCIMGNMEKALEEFKIAALHPKNIYAVEANKAYIYYLQGNIAYALESFAKAASMTEDKRKQSKLYYEAAVILSERKDFKRAVNLLSYAVELDPQNYPVAILLKRLNEAK